MKPIKLLSIVAVSALSLGNVSVGQGCSTWSADAPGTGSWSPQLSDKTGHINGMHFFAGYHSGSCDYMSTGGVGTPCSGSDGALDTPAGNDTGAVYSLGGAGTHVLRFGQTTGSDDGVGIPLAATAKTGVAVEACLFGICSFTVSVAGVGVSVSSGSPLWTAEDTYTAHCPAEWNGCPLILDVAGEGFQLSDAEEGVVTDMVIPGHRIRFAWPKQGSHNAFLWLDNHLFGNSTPQPASDNPNGFAALAVYDSNGDGVIDSKDPVFTNLRLWIDSNHDGVVQSNELFTLPSLGVYSISLQYQQDKYIDQFGNHFNYRGRLRSSAANVDRTVYDVWLSTNN